jgi:hypothetical protein
MSKTTFKDAIRITIGALLLTAGIAYAGTWTAPSQTFPNGNVDAPINVGGSTTTTVGDQVKGGSFWSNKFLGTDGGGFFGGDLQVGTTTKPAKIRIVDGNQGAGKVLTSDANGLASWQAGGTGGSCSLGDMETRNNEQVYQATTDGFVVTSSNWAYSEVYVGNSASNLNIVFKEAPAAQGPQPSWGSMSIPVKQGLYWKVTARTDSPPVIYWQPLNCGGSSGGVSGFIPSTYAGEQSVTFPNGLIMKWGSTTASARGGGTVTFQTPFPNVCLMVQATYGAAVQDTVNPLGVFAFTPSSFKLDSFDWGSQLVYWFATGY